MQSGMYLRALCSQRGDAIGGRDCPVDGATGEEGHLYKETPAKAWGKSFAVQSGFILSAVKTLAFALLERCEVLKSFSAACCKSYMWWH